MMMKSLSKYLKKLKIWEDIKLIVARDQFLNKYVKTPASDQFGSAKNLQKYATNNSKETFDAISEKSIEENKKLIPLAEKVLEVTEKSEVKENLRKSVPKVDIKEIRKSTEKSLKNSVKEIPKPQNESKLNKVKANIQTKHQQKKILEKSHKKIEALKPKEKVGIPSHIVKSSNKKKTNSQQKKKEKIIKVEDEISSNSDSGSSINSTKNKSNLDNLK